MPRRKKEIEGGLAFGFGNGPSVIGLIRKGKEMAPSLIHGRKELPPDVRSLLQKDGDAVIHSITLFRTPLSKALMFSLNVASLGQFKKKLDQSPYDELFHLGMILNTSKGTFTTEKEAVVRITRGNRVANNNKAQFSQVPLNGKHLTLNQLIENGIQNAGMKDFIGYSSKNNNCQCYVMYLLDGSGIGSAENRTFALQNTKQLFEGMDWFRKLTNTVTGLGEKADIIQQGSGRKKKPKVKGGAVSARLVKEFIKASYEAHPRHSIEGFIYDPSVSATTARVYHNPTTGQTILVNRGTEGTASDWGNNVAYAFGRYKHTARFKEAEKVQHMAEAKYGAKNISQISHSQGAVPARYLSKNVKEHITLNPAFKGEKEAENEYVVKSDFDPVSNAYGALTNAVTPRWMKLFQRKKPTKETVIPAKTWNPVEEHLTGVLDRLDPEHQLGKVDGSGRKGRKKERSFYEDYGGYDYYFK